MLFVGLMIFGKDCSLSMFEFFFAAHWTRLGTAVTQYLVFGLAFDMMKIADLDVA